MGRAAGGADGVRVEQVGAEVPRPLRLEVLRRGMPAASARFPGDDHPLAAHVAALDGPDRTVVAAGSVYPDPPPWAPGDAGAWRIRGMATREGWRHRGLGAEVLAALLAHAGRHGGTMVWCHARVGARPFYRRHGFVALGDPFDDGVAVHQSMWRAL